MDKPGLDNGEYVLNPEGIPDREHMLKLYAAHGGIVEHTDQLVIGDSPDCVIPCPYCSLPERWSACPIHRDGQ